MAVDQRLIEGARRVAEAGADANLLEAEAIQEVTNKFSDRMKVFTEKRLQSFESAINKAVDRTDGLTPEQTRQLYTDYKAEKSKHFFGDPVTRAEIEKDVIRRASDIVENDSFIDRIVDKEGDISKELIASKTGQSIENILNGSAPKIWNSNTKTYEYPIYDEESKKDILMSRDKIETIINNNTFDSNVNERLTALVKGAASSSSDVLALQDGTFPKTSYESLVRENIIKSGDLRSLTYDNHVGETDFVTNLNSHLATKSYEDLGISPKNQAVVDMLDPNTDNDPEKISEEDRNTIIKSITSDKNTLKRFLTDYFVQHIKSNWVDAEDSRDNNKDKENKTVEETPSSGLEDQTYMPQM